MTTPTIGSSTQDAIREELDRVLASPEFDASDRNRRFLSFAVGEVLAGRGDRIKAYTIATSVFGRRLDFDPQQDSIVRIEAGRLRRSLERYYLTAGKGDEVQISIPKGSYAPVFHFGQPCASLVDRSSHRAPHSAGARRRHTLFVRPIEADGDDERANQLARVLTRQLIAGFTRFSGVLVYGPETTLEPGATDSLERLRTDLDVDFVLTGGATVSRNQISVEVFLVDTATGRYVWADDHHRPLEPGGAVVVLDDISSAIVRALAQPYGILSTSSASATTSQDAAGPSNARSVALYYRYARTFDRSMYAEVFAALKAASEADPDDAEVLACLSRLWVDVFRYGYDAGQDESDPLRVAVHLALRSIELAPNSSLGHSALGLAYWLTGDIDGSLAALTTAVDLNRNDTEALAELGLRHALRANWSVGIPMLDAAFASNPAHPGPYRMAYCFWHLAHGRFEAALVEARKTEMSKLPHGALITAVAAIHLGLQEEAAAAISDLLRLEPDLVNRPASWLAARHLHPDMIDLIVRGLADARSAIRSADLSSHDAQLQRSGIQYPRVPADAVGAGRGLADTNGFISISPAPMSPLGGSTASLMPIPSKRTAIAACVAERTTRKP